MGPADHRHELREFPPWPQQRSLAIKNVCSVKQATAKSEMPAAVLPPPQMQAAAPPSPYPFTAASSYGSCPPPAGSSAGPQGKLGTPAMSGLLYDVGAYRADLRQSVGPGQYVLAATSPHCRACLPGDPRVVAGPGAGDSECVSQSLVDVESDLHNINRRATNAPLRPLPRRRRRADRLRRPRRHRGSPPVPLLRRHPHRRHAPRQPALHAPRHRLEPLRVALPGPAAARAARLQRQRRHEHPRQGRAPPVPRPPRRPDARAAPRQARPRRVGRRAPVDPQDLQRRRQRRRAAQHALPQLRRGRQDHRRVPVTFSISWVRPPPPPSGQGAPKKSKA